MSGFDNGTMQGGVFFQAKQFGSITRGFGPPVPQSGVMGDLYIDVQNFQLFNKRSVDRTDPWGRYLFVVPVTYQTRLKFFSAFPPTADIGIDGDYFLFWGGYPNYGMQPSIYGPKAAGAWPANPVAVAVTVNPLATAEDTHNVSGAAFAANKNGVDQVGVVSGVFTPVTFATELYDVGGYFAANVWTPPAGQVALSGAVLVSGTIAAGATIAVAIFKNGANFKQGNFVSAVGGGGGAQVNVSDLANGTDTYAVYVYAVTTAGTATVQGVLQNTFFTGQVTG